MPQEIELKLSLPESCQQPFSELPLLQHYLSAEPKLQPQVMQLQNRYFDTADQQLHQHRIALRIRRNDEQFIQTLKTGGSSRGGLHQRSEWEWPVDSGQLELGLLPVDVLPQGVLLEQLEVAFNTDFQRCCWLLDYPLDDQWARIELVLDSGWVSNREQRDPISEIELELKSGPVEALFSLAQELAAVLPLRISRISKAEKGYRLHRTDHAELIPQAPAQLGHFEASNAQQWLDRIQALLEGYLFIADISLLDETLISFEQLGLQLQHGGAENGLIKGLIGQQQGLELLLSESHDENLSQQWLEQRELGVSLLQISQWLYLHH